MLNFVSFCFSIFSLENDIDEELFENLSEKIIREIITSIGYRTKFETAYFLEKECEVPFFEFKSKNGNGSAISLPERNSSIALPQSESNVSILDIGEYIINQGSSVSSGVLVPIEPQKLCLNGK